ncbi:MAG: PilN domain-containing protein [Rhodocyclaceae bacterium]|nr:PilN domain-containing protein [Rhodocyclaceae bacterium]
MNFSSLLERFLASHLFYRLRRGCCALTSAAVARRWLAGQSVRLASSDGQRALVMPGFTPLPPGAPLVDAFDAVLLPADAVLERHLRLSARITGENLLAALRLEVETVSPFPPEETRWGWKTLSCDGTQQHILLAIASAQHIQRHLEAQNRATSPAPEVWASIGTGYVILRGFGEARRAQAQRRSLQRTGALAALAVLLVCVLLLTPALSARQQTVAANRLVGALTQQAAPELKLREELTALHGLQESLHQHFDGQADLPALLDRLTAATPDTVWLARLEYTPDGLKLTGFADDAGAYLKILQAQNGFRNVRIPSSIVRDARTKKERFDIQLEFAS